MSSDLTYILDRENILRNKLESLTMSLARWQEAVEEAKKTIEKAKNDLERLRLNASISLGCL